MDTPPLSMRLLRVSKAYELLHKQADKVRECSATANFRLFKVEICP
jgi:hypothetical protein